MKKQFNFPDSFLYQSTFVWLEDRGREIYRIGLTDYGQHTLDDIISITLPEEGVFFEREEELASIDSIEDSFILEAPISGTIIEVNEELRQSPELLNESPFEEGWILEIELGSSDDEDYLMDSNEVLDRFHEEYEEEEDDEEEEGEESFNFEEDFENY